MSAFFSGCAFPRCCFCQWRLRPFAACGWETLMSKDHLQPAGVCAARLLVLAGDHKNF